MMFFNYGNVVEWLKDFNYKTSYDHEGEKRYFSFNDFEKGGQCTLMKYDNDVFTVHSKGENYCDDKEIEIKDYELIKFVWRNRKAIHKEFKG